jgi:hypothetical protein
MVMPIQKVACCQEAGRRVSSLKRVTSVVSSR